MISASVAFQNALASRIRKPVYLLEIAGYPRIFSSGVTGVPGHYPWITSAGSLSQSADVLNGTSTLSDLSIGVLDARRAITTDLAAFTFEGKTATLKIGYVGMAVGDYLTRTTMVVNKVENDQANNVYIFRLRDFSRLLSQVIYRTGDAGGYTSNDDPRTVTGNPMDILTDILTAQLDPAPAVNAAAIAAYKGGLFAGAKLRYSITSAPHAKDWLDREIFKALGGYLFQDNLGQLTPWFFVSRAVPASPLALTDQNIIEIPTPAQSDPLNFVTYRLDYEEDKAQRELTIVKAASVAKYGLQTQLVTEGRGVRSIYQGMTWAALLAHWLFLRYADKPLTVSLRASYDALLVEVGDYVSVTHPAIPDRAAGSIGWTNEICEVTAVEVNLDNAQVELSLLDMNWLASMTAYEVAPDTQVDWTFASETEKATRMFVASAATGKYSDGAWGNEIF